MHGAVPFMASLAFVLAGAATAQTTPAELSHHENASAVAATERAFDAFTAEHGFTAGFMEFAAPDGILFRPDPVIARDFLAAQEPSTDTALRWGPARVGVAATGDLAWDTGPWTYGDDAAHGWFFTIWVRQPDGRWRWALDHGAGPAPAHVAVPAPEDVLVDPAAMSAAPGNDSLSEVEALDGQLGDFLVLDGWRRAYSGRLADDAWVTTRDAGPARNPRDVDQALGARPRFTAFERIGGRASASGDLAYTYGHLRWGEGAEARRGHYIRVWRRDAAGSNGWRLVWDQFSPVPPAPASAG